MLEDRHRKHWVRVYDAESLEHVLIVNSRKAQKVLFVRVIER